MDPSKKESLSQTVHSTAQTGAVTGSTQRLQGLWLGVLRWIWLVLVILFICFFVLAIPLSFDQLLHPDSVTQHSLLQVGISIYFYSDYIIAIDILFMATYCIVAFLIFWYQSDEWIALFTAFFLVLWGILQPVSFWNFVTSDAVWQIPIDVSNALSWTCLNLFLLLFPTGRFVPRWTRWFALWLLLYVLLWHLPDTLWFTPSHWAGPLSAGVELGGYAVTIFAVIYRYRSHSNALERQQTKWVVFGVVVMLIAASINFVLSNIFSSSDQASSLYNLFGSSLLSVIGLIMPLFIIIAILRYRLWRIDIIINRTLVYAALTFCIVSAYVLIVVTLGTLLQQTQGNILISLLATSIIAIGFQPLRMYLQQSVNRLMYGERDNPYAVLTRLGQRLGTAIAPEAVLPTITETVAQALKLPYTAITLQQDHGTAEIASSYGHPPTEPNLLSIPLVYQQEKVGEFVLAPRSKGEILNMTDQRLLYDLAQEIGVAVHAVRLHIHLQQVTVDLQRSRERLVVTREEERRRLRRDLHDGLGPTLAGFALTTNTIIDLIEADSSTALMLANRLQSEIHTTISDVRRLVYELRPPALDELGLVAAIRERAEYYQAQTHTSANTRPLVTVEAPEQIPTLPAAVEVAAFRIVMEAMTNVLRHAQAHICVIRLSITDNLQIEVVDDGIGLPSEYVSGVGLLSIRERVGELNGTYIVERPVTRGTRICVKLPLMKE